MQTVWESYEMGFIVLIKNYKHLAAYKKFFSLYVLFLFILLLFFGTKITLDVFDLRKLLMSVYLNQFL